MALTLQRTIYTNSDVSVQPTVGAANSLASWPVHLGGTTQAWVATVQNATFTLNIPRADVNVFGLQGTLDRPQLEAETATLEFGFIPEACGSPSVENTGAIASLNHEDLNLLIQDTIHNTPDYVDVRSANVGAITKSLMNSLSGEASVGALPTFTASFTGATAAPTDPAYEAGGTGQYPSVTAAGPITAPVKVVDITDTDRAKIVTPKDIDLFHVAATKLINEDFPDGDTDGEIDSCAQSGSFSWDVPVETILCLGANPSSDGIALGNPPGTSSFTVEALSAQLQQNVLAQDYAMLFGHYLFTLVAGNIDSRTHNLAVGDIFGTYNYVIGGTGDGFTVAKCP